MAHIGDKKIVVPSGVTIALENGTCRVKGPKGEQIVSLKSGLSAVVSDGAKNKELAITCADTTDPLARALHGTIRNEIANAVVGVTEMFQKVLEINGVGYRAAVSGKTVTLTLGFSRPVTYELPNGIEASVEKQTLLSLRGCNKYLVGQVACQIRAFRKPEPYKGKGIKYKDERILRKEGKTGKKEK